MHIKSFLIPHTWYPISCIVGVILLSLTALVNLLSRTVVHKGVRATGTSVDDNTSGSKRLDASGKSSRGTWALKTDEVSCETGDVWAGHGSAGDGVGGGAATDPSTVSRVSK